MFKGDDERIFKSFISKFDFGFGKRMFLANLFYQSYFFDLLVVLSRS